MKEEVDKVLKTGDSVDGVFEVVAHNVPPGLGTYVQWDERLDAMLAAAVMSLQAVKAVEIGSGVTAASHPAPPFATKSATAANKDSPPSSVRATTPEASKAALRTDKTSVRGCQTHFLRCVAHCSRWTSPPVNR